MLNAAEHLIDPFLDGFIVGLTPQSSNVALFAVNRDRKELFVRFRNGSQYLYGPVDVETLDKAVKAESIGKFVSRSIVKKFDATKIEKVVFHLVDKSKEPKK